MQHGVINLRYIYGVLLPVLCQALVVWAVVEGTRGDGSFTGLGAYLLGMMTMPLTALVNGIWVYTQRDWPVGQVILKCWLLALAMPVLVTLLALLG